DAADILATGLDLDVDGDRFGLDLDADPPAQRQAAAHAFHVHRAAVEVEADVATDAADIGLARRADRDDVAADAFDGERVAGHAVDLDGHGHAIDLDAGLLRHVEHQRGRFG